MGACCSKALQLGVVAGLTFGAGRLAHRYNRTSATAGFRAFTKGIGEEMTIARASTREEALRLLNTSEIAVVELDYETGWQDAVELGRMGQKAGIRVEFRSQENIAVRSLKALVAGLSRPKLTFRQRNLYCQFDLDALPTGELEKLEAKTATFGDYILGGHLLHDVDVRWDE